MRELFPLFPMSEAAEDGRRRPFFFLILMTPKPIDPIQLEADSPTPVAVQIADWFRKAIADGRLAPGQKLPSNGAIAAEAGASCTAVQKAFAMLTREGLVSRKPRRGTFVNERENKPTVLLVFGVNLMAEAAYFYRAVGQACHAEAARRKVNLRIFSLPLETSPASPGQEKEFLEAVKGPGVAGALLFAIDPDRVSRSLRNIPWALFEPGHPANDLTLDRAHYIQTALEYFASQGLKRLAYICTRFESVEYDGTELNALLRLVAEKQFEMPQLIPLVLLNSGREHEEKACRMMLEVCSDWDKTGKPPQGLVVNDDIMMRPVALALARGGYEIPGKMMPIVRTIEEYEHHYAVPVLRYTMSMREVAGQLFQRLWDRRAQPKRKFAEIAIRGCLQEKLC